MMYSAATVAFGCPTSFGLKGSPNEREVDDYREYRPEEKLPIEVADIDSIHINDMNVLEAHERQVRKDLASQTSSTDHQYLRLAQGRLRLYESALSSTSELL